jgi:hypothetical protein
MIFVWVVKYTKNKVLKIYMGGEFVVSVEYYFSHIFLGLELIQVK